MMRLLLIFYFLTSTVLLFAGNSQIKSMKTYARGDETSPPIITLGGHIVIEFDIDLQQRPDWIIVFRFCDKDWKPYNNLFLANQGYNTEHNLWFESLPVTVEGAHYHFKQTFPNENVTFPFAGKWKYFITDFQDTSIVFAKGRFIVVNPFVPMDVRLRRERLEGSTPEPATFGEIYRITARGKLPDTLFEYYLENIEIIENQKFDFPVIVNKGELTEHRFYESDEVNAFTFVVKDIQPGNEYRQTDLMDRSKHNPPITKAQFDGVEVSRLFKPGGKDFNGGSILKNYKSDFAEYMNVQFELRLPDEFANVFIAGSFTDWKVLPEYLMSENDGLHSITLELKRGIYDYVYVTGNPGKNYFSGINWLSIEGNDWNTNNDYYIFLFYKNQNYGTYDEIVGYTKLSSGRK